MNLFNGDEDLQRRYADALKTSVDKTFGVEMNNERSLAKEITEGFEALKSMRNNEPVAWMLADKEAEHIRSIMAVKHDFVPKGCVEIPLYTHPVKEQDTDCQYCKQGCIRCDARKQLTDEEIAEVFDNTFKVRDFEDAFLKFARAILRKAQE